MSDGTGARGQGVGWLQQPLRSAALQTTAHALGMGGLTIFVDAICEGWKNGEWIGLAVFLLSYAVRGADSFLEALAGRWIASPAYLVDRERSWWARLFRYAAWGLVLGLCWGAAKGWIRGVSTAGYPAYLNWFIPGFVGASIVFRVIAFLFRVWCEGISARVTDPVPTTWLLRPAPVVTWGRRAVGFGAVAAACAYLVVTAPPLNKAAPIVEKVMLGAIVITFVFATKCRTAAAKCGATRRIVQ